MMRLIALPLWLATMIAGFAIVGAGLSVLYLTEIRHRSKGADHV